MRAIAGILFSFTVSGIRAAARGIAAAGLVAALVASGDAHAVAERITPVQDDALARMATEMLVQGTMVPFDRARRAALVGLGAAGLYLGTSSEIAGGSGPARPVRSAAFRLALPLAGAALGSLVACDSLCDGQEMAADPLVGAMAGALVAHVLDRDTRAGHMGQIARDARPRVQWTPTVTVGPGSYGVGVMGRF